MDNIARSHCQLKSKNLKKSSKHANENDLIRLEYTISLSKFINKIQLDLSNRAIRWLNFFCALNQIGYLGYKGYIDALIQAEHKSNMQTKSRSTAFRSLNELVKKGFLFRSISRIGKWRQISIDCGCRDQIVGYTLTQKAIDVWKKTTKCKNDSVMCDKKLQESNCTGLDLTSDFLLENTQYAHDDIVLSIGNSDGNKSGVANATDKQTIVNCTAIINSSAKQRNNKPTKIKTDLKAKHAISIPRRKNLLIKTIIELTSKTDPPTRTKILNRCIDEMDELRRETSINWSYWLKKWPDLDRPQKKSICFREIITPIKAVYCVNNQKIIKKSELKSVMYKEDWQKIENEKIENKAKSGKISIEAANLSKKILEIAEKFLHKS